MSLRRGCFRLAASLVVMWFVFWNFAYVMGRHSSLIAEPATFAIRISAWGVVLPCAAAIVVLGLWVALGFRPSER